MLFRKGSKMATKTKLHFTEDSVHRAVQNAYGTLADAVDVNEVFLPHRGWVPSYAKDLQRREATDVTAFLNELVQVVNAEQVNLKIVGSSRWPGYANADFSLTELAE